MVGIIIRHLFRYIVKFSSIFDIVQLIKYSYQYMLCTLLTIFHNSLYHHRAAASPLHPAQRPPRADLPHAAHLLESHQRRVGPGGRAGGGVQRRQAADAGVSVSAEGAVIDQQWLRQPESDYLPGMHVSVMSACDFFCPRS